ncbi:uncharacterized protein LOC117181210 [Belonocnema kinseyi]|uniref:uncharacterized protein LOC117181210 n=1 Tax=Belonocnema kinseyi TaxID=2817044 RepID=UPI00143D32CB|nr:uncharacterized protein LOC117181210 [Belonocnema kinseyi]
MFGKLVFLWWMCFYLDKGHGFTAKGLMYPGRSDLFELSVIHINDFHARFLQTGPTSGTCSEIQEQDCIGGIARVLTASRQLLKERPNAIFLNAGDHYQGTLWYNLFKWNVTALFMNKLPHDVMTIGNHEFDDGIAGLVPFLQRMKAPVVVSNIDVTNEPTMKGLYQNSTIIERDGKKIGVIGVILSTTNIIANTEQLVFYDEVKSVNAEAEKLKSEGVEIIIVLSHCGLDVDRIMAEKCPNIDIIVGGHSHTFLYSGNPPFSDVPEDDYPIHVKQEDLSRTVLIVQAAAFTRYIGNLTVWFDPRGEILDWEGDPILLDHSIEEDSEMLKALEPWKEEADKLGKAQIGTTKVYLQGLDICRKGACNLANVLTDAMVDYYVGQNDKKTYWTRAAISVMNAGGIRGDISDDPGSITYEDLVVVQPFANSFDVVELKGSDILKTLEKAALVSYSSTKFIGKSFLQWSGIKVTYNLSNADNSRVIDAKVRCQICEFPKYENLVPEEWYKVVVPSFLLSGGDNHTDIQHGYRNREPGPVDIDVIADFIRKKSPITTGVEGRITLLGSWNKPCSCKSASSVFGFRRLFRCYQNSEIITSQMPGLPIAQQGTPFLVTGKQTSSDHPVWLPPYGASKRKEIADSFSSVLKISSTPNVGPTYGARLSLENARTFDPVLLEVEYTGTAVISAVIERKHSLISSRKEIPPLLLNEGEMAALRFDWLVCHVQILRNVITRWLSLFPAIGRLLQKWPAIKQYFINQGKEEVDQIIWKFLGDQENEINDDLNAPLTLPECYLYFDHNFVEILTKSIKLLEAKNVMSTDVHETMVQLRDYIQARLNDGYYGSRVKNSLKHLDQGKRNKFEKEANNVYQRTLQYLQNWYDYEKSPFQYFLIINLKSKTVKFEDILQAAKSVAVTVDEDKLYDEVILLVSVFPKISKLELRLDLKWVEIFKDCDAFKELPKIVGKILSIPISNEFDERIFSLMGNLWTDERNRLGVNMVRAELLTKLNFNMSCEEFEQFMSEPKQLKLLRKVISQKKYSWKNAEKGMITTVKFPGRSDLIEFSVIHINDFHARFLQTGPDSGICKKGQEQECIGGIARVSTASRHLLKNRPNAIFLSAGDQFQGSFWYFLFKWNATAKFMNKLPLDALTIGNHEFDDGISGLVPFLQRIKAPVVVSNMDETNEPTLKGLYHKSTIIGRNGRKIGVIGLILSTVNTIARTGRLEFHDEVKTLDAEAKTLRAQGVKIIIALTHCGINIDRIIAEKSSYVDIIVGGHSHTFLYTGNKPYSDVPEDTYPVVVKQKESSRTVLIVQAAAFTRYIGNLTVRFDSEGEVIEWEGNPILLDHSIEEDPEILKALQPWKEEADLKGEKQIGTTKVYLHGSETCQKGECSLGNVFTDAMVDHYAGKDNNKDYWTHVAISALNGGDIRGDISDNPGSITYEDLAVILPFGDSFDVVELKGSDILKSLEKAVLTSLQPTIFISKIFLQWSGLKVTYNLSNPDNSRVINVQVRCQACKVPKYENLVPEEWYKVVITTFLLNGGDNHTDIQHGYRNREPGPLDIDVIASFIGKTSPIQTGVEGRITLLGSWNKP